MGRLPPADARRCRPAAHRRRRRRRALRGRRPVRPAVVREQPHVGDVDRRRVDTTRSGGRRARGAGPAHRRECTGRARPLRAPEAHGRRGHRPERALPHAGAGPAAVAQRPARRAGAGSCAEHVGGRAVRHRRPGPAPARGDHPPARPGRRGRGAPPVRGGPGHEGGLGEPRSRHGPVRRRSRARHRVGHRRRARCARHHPSRQRWGIGAGAGAGAQPHLAGLARHGPHLRGDGRRRRPLHERRVRSLPGAALGVHGGRLRLAAVLAGADPRARRADGGAAAGRQPISGRSETWWCHAAS